MGEGKKYLTTHMTPAQLRLTPRRIIHELSKVKADHFEDVIKDDNEEDEQENNSDESVRS